MHFPDLTSHGVEAAAWLEHCIAIWMRASPEASSRTYLSLSRGLRIGCPRECIGRYAKLQFRAGPIVVPPSNRLVCSPQFWSWSVFPEVGLWKFRGLLSNAAHGAASGTPQIDGDIRGVIRPATHIMAKDRARCSQKERLCWRRDGFVEERNLRRLHKPKVWISSGEVRIGGRQPSFQIRLVCQQPHRAVEVVRCHHLGPQGKSQIPANQTFFPRVKCQQSNRRVRVSVEAFCEPTRDFPSKPNRCPQSPRKLRSVW